MIKLRLWQERGEVFLVWRPENRETEEDAREVFAADEEEAAEDWAEHDDADSVEYAIVKGDDATVLVRKKDGGPVRKFVVTGEAVPHYSAREATA